MDVPLNETEFQLSVDILPNETLTHILRYISTRRNIDSMEACLLVCWRWRDVACRVRLNIWKGWKLVNTAAKNKHTDLLSWLMQRGGLILLGVAKYVVSTNRLDLIQQLPVWHLRHLTQYAAGRCSPDVVKYFIDEFCDKDYLSMSDRALKHKNIPVLDMLLRNYVEQITAQISERIDALIDDQFMTKLAHGIRIECGRTRKKQSAGPFAMSRPYVDKHTTMQYYRETPLVSRVGDSSMLCAQSAMMSIEPMQQVLGRCSRHYSHDERTVSVTGYGHNMMRNILQQHDETAQEQLRQFTQPNPASGRRACNHNATSRQNHHKHTVSKQCDRRTPGLRRR